MQKKAFRGKLSKSGSYTLSFGGLSGNSKISTTKRSKNISKSILKRKNAGLFRRHLENCFPIHLEKEDLLSKIACCTGLST